MSFSIKSGQLVVIVGPNGSGKSTLIKLLNRLYNHDSGDILIDGKDVTNYKISDLRKATADLSQETTLYPLSIGENIGIGDPSEVTNMTRITKAAEKGGSYEFISGLKDGFATIMDPVKTASMGYFNSSGNHPLKEIYEEWEKKVDSSGKYFGNLCLVTCSSSSFRWRTAKACRVSFVAPSNNWMLIIFSSRTFMRLQSDDIKCVTVDEPSSALDPQGEFELFQSLREAKGGKTMIFVTHRFGHLTKHADVIM